MAKRSRPARSAQRAKPVEHPIEHAATCRCGICETTRAKDRAPCLVGYARVSTDEQETRQQVDALNAAGCSRIFVDDGISGSTTSRPELDKCLAALQPGDTLVVWKLDRFGRTAGWVATTLDALQSRGVAFRSLTEAIDPSTPMGKCFLTILAAFAQMERAVTIERINLALKAKKARGEPLGRPRKLDENALATARRELAAGTPSVRVARTLGVSKAALYASLARPPAT
jgi:DNA invertase Pin-like site-specific DNA recombinase